MSLSLLSACGLLGALEPVAATHGTACPCRAAPGNGAWPAAGKETRVAEHRVPHRPDGGPCGMARAANAAAPAADAVPRTRVTSVRACHRAASLSCGPPTLIRNRPARRTAAASPDYGENQHGSALRASRTSTGNYAGHPRNFTRHSPGAIHEAADGCPAGRNQTGSRATEVDF
jgi:hypothetical protein